MASLVRHDSNSTQYSWWWVSHISPKNSKWLQENLTDMDVMVKAMIKLINEDADSFARRAEMYYKKRPELMKLVEEFYRAYRALAERYDQATGALRHAHRTISEAFPNQMPSMSEESPSSGQEVEPRTPEMPTHIRAPFDLDDPHKDVLGVSPQILTVKRNGTHPDEIGALSSRKGLKQFSDLFASGDSAHCVSFSDGKVRKGLSFESPDIKGKEDVGNDIMNLQHEVSKLLAESQSLKQQISSESDRANNAESEIQSLKDTISCLSSEKDTALLQCSQSTKRLSALESELYKAHADLKKLSDYMAIEVEKLNSAESRNSEMQSELETLGQKIWVQEQEIEQSRKEMECFHFSLQEESAKHKQAEDALRSIEKQYAQSQEEANRLTLEMATANDRLNEFKQAKLNLENAICKLKKEVESLTEQNHFSEILIEELRGDINSLMDSKNKLENKIQALRSTISQINSEKDAALVQHRQSIEEVSDLESKLSKAQSEQEKIERKVQMLVHELEQKREEADIIHAQLQDEHYKHVKRDAALLAMENLHTQSQEEAKKLSQDLEHLNKKLSDLENNNIKLHDMSQGLKKTVSELNSKKDAALLQQQKSLERVSCLEAQLLVAQPEMEKIKQKSQMLEQELEHKNKVVDNLLSSLQKEGQKRMLAEAALLRVECLHSQSQEEAKTLAQDLENLSKKLSEVENDRLDLQKISQELKNTISEMNSEKDATLLQQQQSLVRVSYLEAQLLEAQSELQKNKQKVQLLEQELEHKNEEVNSLQNNLEVEGHKRMYAEAALIMAENLHSKSQEEVSKLVLDLEKLNKKLSEVQNSKLSMEELSYELKNTISLLNSEKDAALLQQQQSLEKISDLKSQVSKTQLKLEKTEQKVEILKQELAQKSGKVDILQSSLQDEGKKRVHAETALMSVENMYTRSQEELTRLAPEVESLNRKLNEVEKVSSELKNAILLLNSEKDTILLQHKQSLARVSVLESKLCEVQAERENVEQKAQMLDKELKQKTGEMDSLQTSLQDEARKCIEGEAALLTMTNLHCQSQEEVNRLALEIEKLNRKLNEVENVSSDLKNSILLLNSEKDMTLLQHKQSLMRVSVLESELSEVQADRGNVEQKVQMLNKELIQKREEVNSLQTSLQNEAWKRIEGEVSLVTMTNLHCQSQEEVNRLALEIERLNRELNEMENMSSDLKKTILLLNSEIDKTLLQHKQSLVRASDLESELSEVQIELENVEQKAQMLDNELKQKREEVDSLQTSLQDEAQKCIEGEAALLVVTNLHSQSQEEVNRLALKIEKLSNKLNEMENRNVDLENMICKHTEEICILGEQNISDELTIRGLHDELDMLKGMKVKLENEVGIHIGEKEVLQHDLAHQKESKEILEKQHCSLEDEMKAVKRREATLQHLLEELHNKNFELKEACTMHDAEKALLLEKVCNMEKLSEEYSILENSFSNAIVEMEALKEIIKALEASESSLKDDVSFHISEKDALALELEILGKKYAYISEKSSILETSLSDVNSELGELGVKFKNSEESSRSYLANNSALLSEKDDILSQLEKATLAMKALEDKHVDLGVKHSSLLTEKDLLCSQLRDLQDQLEIENKQHEALLKLHQMQINDFEDLTSSLQEKIRYMDQMLEQEQQKCTCASISSLILKNSLADVKNKNFTLFNECHKFIEATHSAEVLIARLKEDAKNQEEEKKALLKYNEKLRDGISQQMKLLNICKNLGPPDVVLDEIILQTLSRETLNHLKHTEESDDKNVFMDVELSVLGAILTQIGIDFRDLHLQKCDLVKELETGAAELLILQNKNHELLDLNEQLRQRLQKGMEREEMLKTEVLGLHAKLSCLKESYQTSQNEICILTEKNESLSQEHQLLVEKYNALDDENAAVLAECIMLDHLSLFFSNRNNESTSALTSLTNDMATLCLVKQELDHEVEVLNRRAKILAVDYKHLKNTLDSLMEVLRTRLVLSEFDLNTNKSICQELVIELENGMAQLVQKDDRLRKADENVQLLQKTNQELCGVLGDLQAAVEGAKGVKGELEKKIATLTEEGIIRDKEILVLCKANMALQGEVGIHKQKEETLTSTLKTVTKEGEQHEREIVALVSDMITCSVNLMVYEEQVLELMMECEAFEIRMITEREMLMKQISSRDAYVDELHKSIASIRGENAELKAEKSTYLPLVTSLSDQISVLEEGTLLLSELNKEGKLEFVQEGRYGSESQDNLSVALDLQRLIARVEALRVVILDAKDRRDKECTESAAKLEAANVEIQELKARKGSCYERKEQYMEDDRKKYDTDNSKGKQVQIMKDIELDQVSTCSPYGTGAALYRLDSVAHAKLDDEMLQLWETAERDCKNQTAKSSSSEHDIQAVEEVKSEYPSFELARGRDLGIDRLEISTVSLEPGQIWSKNVLEKLGSDAQRLSIIQASIEEVKQKMQGTLKGKSPMSSEYSSIRTQLQEIEGFVLEQIDSNNNLTKKAENYPVLLEVNAELEGYSSRRKISEQVQKGSEKVARLELELQKIQYVLLKLEEEHEYKRVKVSEKRTRVLLRDYMYGRKNKNDAGQKKKRVPFCGCVRLKTKTEP